MFWNGKGMGISQKIFSYEFYSFKILKKTFITSGIDGLKSPGVIEVTFHFTFHKSTLLLQWSCFFDINSKI